MLGIGTFLQIWAYGVAGELLTMRLRSMTFATMLKQEMAWFDNKSNTVGALCSRLSSDTSNVQGVRKYLPNARVKDMMVDNWDLILQATGQPIGAVVQGIATISLAISFAMISQWKLGLTTLAFTPFLFTGSYFLARVMKGGASGNRKILEKSSKVYLSEYFFLFLVAKNSIHVMYPCCDFESTKKLTIGVVHQN